MRLVLGLATIALWCAAAFFVGRATVDAHRTLDAHGTPAHRTVDAHRVPAHRTVDAHRVPARGSFDAGYLAGREAAFAGYDGGWAYGAPYIVVLQRGGPGITYRVARRIPLMPGIEYRRCGSGVCSTP
jgi:hypothetical protein